jgi:hypothetical protein
MDADSSLGDELVHGFAAPRSEAVVVEEHGTT